MVELIHGMRDLRIGHRRQIPVFREVLTDETIGVLVQAPFPRGIRMREVDRRGKVTRHAFMVGELAAIVIGDAMNPVLVRGEPFGNGASDGLGRLLEDRPDHRVP